MKDLLLTIGPVPFQGIVGNPGAFGDPSNLDLTAPNGSQSPGYLSGSGNPGIPPNFDKSGFDRSLNVQAGFVSRQPVRNLLYTGSTTIILVDVQDWFGPGIGHIDVGYTSNDTTYQQKQIAEILARGIDGVWWTWSGVPTGHSGRLLINEAELKGLAQCAAQGALCALMLDKDGFGPDITSDPTQTIKDYLTYANANYFGSSAYAKISGRPIVGFFAQELVPGINWSAIDSHGAGLSNGHPWWVFRNNTAFSNPIGKGTLAWPSPPEDAAYLNSFYSAALAHPSYTTFGTAYKGFDDHLASWSAGRVIPQRSGQTWLDCFKKINSIYSSSFQLPYLVIATWDDYEEGTEIETGISGNLTISPVITGTTLTWTVTGNEAAYYGYGIYSAPAATPNSTTLLGDTLVGQPRTFDLSVAVPSGIAATYFGMHTLDPVAHWPSVSFGAVRPANVAWNAVETARGVYSWTALDTWVSTAASNSVEFNYLFLKTPAWSQAVPDVSKPPDDLTDWDDFVTAVVTRYAGQIQSYELWNEPNDPAYWSASIGALVTMAQRAYAIIKAIDPAAKVLTPSPTWTSTTAYAWMNSYLTAGGGAYADVIAYHAYTGYPAVGEAIVSVLDGMNGVLSARGVTKPQWITEGGWGLNSSASLTSAEQAAFLAQRYVLMSAHGVSRFYWYQWDNTLWGTLWTSGGGVNQAGTAYQQVYDWLVGSTFTGIVKKLDSTYVCSFTQGGRQIQVVWNATGTVSYSYPAGFVDYTDLAGTVTGLSGGTVSVGNSPIMLRTAAGATLSPGSYLISVYAVGLACIQNVLAKSIPFTI